jgi:phosphatidylserine/phosphatidylglycerophosphate/cardiolipin synthase-like enzyme
LIGNTNSQVLTIHQIPAKIIDIIENAEKYCFIVTPYYQPWNILNRSLDRAASQNKKIIFIIRNEKVSDHTINRINVELGFDLVLVNRLHTKLYLNEKEALISSMNLVESSKEHNYEIGYSIHGNNQSKMLKEKIIENDILSINQHTVYKGRYFNDLSSDVYIRENDIGFCIRCSKKIEFAPEYSLCSECYSSWVYYKNYDHSENYCHKCGKENSTTKLNPLCESCSHK